QISNGFDPAIRSTASACASDQLALTDRSRRTYTLLHSGTLTPARPLTPLISALADPRLAGSFRLVLHGYLSPASRAEVALAQRAGKVQIEVLAPSRWREAVGRIATADACLITQ